MRRHMDFQLFGFGARLHLDVFLICFRRLLGRMARRNEAPPRRRTVVAAPDVLRYIDVNVSGVSEWALVVVYPNVDRDSADIEWRSAATAVAKGALAAA